MTITNFSLHSNAKRIRPTQTKMAAIAVNLLKQVRPRRNIANRASKNIWNMSFNGVSYPLFRNMKVHFPYIKIIILFFFETAFEIQLFFLHYFKIHFTILVCGRRQETNCFLRNAFSSCNYKLKIFLGIFDLVS